MTRTTHRIGGFLAPRRNLISDQGAKSDELSEPRPCRPLEKNVEKNIESHLGAQQQQH
jgi:hypothetical protein